MERLSAVTLTPGKLLNPALERINALSEFLGVPKTQAASILIMAAPEPISWCHNEKAVKNASRRK